MSDPVTTNDDDTTAPEDDMLATSIDPADLGETPEPRTSTPTVERPLTHEQIVAAKPELIARVEKIIGAPLGSDPVDPDEYPVPASDLLADRRAENYRKAWESSLQASDVTDLQDWRLDALAADQFPQQMTNYANDVGTDNPRVRTLILGGNTGPGKTSSAIAAGWRALERGMSVRFVEHAKYLKWLRPNGIPDRDHPYAGLTADAIERRMRDVDLLILDDLAASLTLNPAEPVTQFVKEQTLTLIGDRIDTPGKFTIVTVNYNSDTLTDMFGEQFVSRLSKRGHVLRFEGPDRRKRLSW